MAQPILTEALLNVYPERRDGCALKDLTKRKGTSHSPPVEFTGTFPPTVIDCAEPVIRVDLGRHQEVEIWYRPTSSPLVHQRKI